MKTILAILLFAAPVLAQTSAGSITGTVADSHGAMVPKVRIAATNVATNVTQTVVSSSTGNFNFPSVEPGQYRVTAEIEGFKRTALGPVTVETARPTTVDFKLEVGDVATQVSVSGEAPQVQDSSSTVQYGIQQQVLDTLPLPNQAALGVLLTIPGVTGDPGSDEGAYHTGLITPGTGVSVSGGRPGATQFQADGMTNTAIFQGRIAISFSSDSLQEVTVQVNSYNAEYGRVGGGIVNMVTKSGTNQLHGTLFGFLQNDALNAAPYQNAWQPKNPLRYMRAGLDVGGPVYLPKLYNGRNRTFFFAGYEPLRQYTGVASFVRAPTALERKGDFSQTYLNSAQTYPTLIFQHFVAGTGKQITEPANTAYPLLGTSIPQSLISPIGQAIINLFPLPNTTPLSTGENYKEIRQVRNTDNRYLVKMDQVLSSNARASFRVAEAPMYANRFVYGNPIIENAPSDQTTTTNAALSETQIWGGNKVNDFRVGYNRFNYSRRENDVQLSQDFFTQYGFPSLLDKGFPVIAINPGGNHFTTAGYAAGTYEIDNSFQLTDTFNWTKGSHSLKMGFQLLAPQQNLINEGQIQGSWAFDSTTNNIGSGNTATYPGLMTTVANTGFAWAGLLLGYPTSISIGPQAIPYQYRWKNYAGFLQDDWKVTSRLTLNLGVRYQVEIPRSEKHHNQGTFVPDEVTNSAGAQQIGYVQMDGLGGTSNTLFPTRYNNIEPRVGLAYRPPKVLPGLAVIRAAYAISHVPTSTLFTNPIPDLTPPAESLASSGGVNGGWVQLDHNPLGLPNQGVTWPADGKLVNLQNLSAVYYLNPHVIIPYVQQWNFGLGFDFGRGYSLEATYVGSKGTNLFGPSGVFNQINLQQYTTEFDAGVNLSATVPNPAGLKGTNGAVIQVTQANLLRPNPTVGDIADPLAQGYNSNYNSLQVVFQKHYSHGLQVNVNYTWSKSMDESSCEGQFCGVVGPWYTGSPQLLDENRKVDYSVSAFDVPHNLRFSYVWDLPVGKGKMFMTDKPRWVNAVVGNWKLSGLGSLQSGEPVTIYNGSNSSGTNAGWPDDVGFLRPNLVLGVNPVNPNWRANLNTPLDTPDAYLNTAAFTPATRLTLGNVPRTIPWLRSPAAFKYDMSILKEFPVREGIKVVLRGELYGALNHPIFMLPSNEEALYTGLDYVHYVNPPVATANYLTSFTNLPGGTIGGSRTVQLGIKVYF
jgi:hypothetical protein